VTEATSPFPPDQERTLSIVLDAIIPPSEDGRFPGAGELGLVDYIALTLQRSPELAPVVATGLSLLDDLAAARGSQDFAALCAADRAAVLRESVTDEPGFLPSLVFHTYVGYYQNGRVLEALGLEPRPPHPKGYDLEAGDLALLARVRRRPKLYREV